MVQPTARFVSELSKSHTVYNYVQAISPSGQTVTLTVVDGEVNVDRTAQYRRAARLICLDPDNVFVPDGIHGILTPFGTEIRPYRGVVYQDGTTETYPLGVFRLANVTITESAGGSQNSYIGVSLQLEMYDRSRVVARDKFLVPYTIAAGTNVIDAIKLIIARTFPDARYDVIASTVTLPAPMVFNAADDPWAAVTTLAQSIGSEIFFDANGIVVVAAPPDVNAMPSPAYSYVEGPGCTMTDISSIYSDEPGFNGVIVTGASLGNELPPVRAEAWDMEPSSPTYRLGPYGEVPMFVTSQTVTTVADAQSTATALLRGQIGFASQLSISGWSNPAFEAGDVVKVVRTPMKVSGLYTVDSFTVPMLKENEQVVNVRQQTAVS